MDDVLSELPVPGAVHRMSETQESLLVAGFLEPFVVLLLCLEGKVERRGVSSFGTSSDEPIRECRLDLHDLIHAIVQVEVESGTTNGSDRSKATTYAKPTKAATPSVSSYFVSGLHNQTGRSGDMLRKDTHEALSCSVDLPESMKEESRLFAKTSGLTSRTQWYVARRRKT